MSSEDKLNTRLGFLLSSSPAIIYTCEAVPPYAATFISANLSKILGYTENDFLFTPNFWVDHIHPEDRDQVLASLSHLFDDGKHLHDYRFQHRDGGWIWMRDELYVVTGSDGNISELIGYFIEITDFKKKENALIESRNLLKTIVDTVPVRIFWKDRESHFLGCNQAFARDAGVAFPNDILGKNDCQLVWKEQAASYRNDDQQVIDSGTPILDYEEPQTTPDGRTIWLRTSKVPLRDANSETIGVLGIYQDITEQRQNDEIILTQANYDELTGLPNRNLFKDRLDREIRKSHRNGLSLSLLFLDLDHFKDINDTLGHDKGDKLLKEVASRLMSCVRETDTVSRLGGDEFAIILPEIANKLRIETIAQHIIQELSKPFSLDEKQIGHYISSSIGIVIYPEDVIDMKSLMKHVDQAMYAAKLGGRNRFNYFTRSMQQEAVEKMELTHDLRQAMARNELQVYYQPILELTHKRIIKAEALLRWNHPQRGMISPSNFIPLAEESGLIIEIGELVFMQTIANIKQWHNQFGYIVQISINMSPTQLNILKINQWSDSLIQQGLPGNCINVEITEGLLLKDTPIVKNRLLEYRNSGIKVSIDDFGTGFSSLSYLKKFDIDYLKIDRSFINHLTDNGTDRALVEAIIVMAHKLGIKTIAEGVETKEQQTILIDFACNYAQGFLYSPAITVEKFAKLLDQQRDQFDTGIV